MPKTPHRKYRLGQDVIAQLDSLRLAHNLDTETDVVRFAITRLFHDTFASEKKTLKKSEKSA